MEPSENMVVENENPWFGESQVSLKSKLMVEWKLGGGCKSKSRGRKWWQRWKYKRFDSFRFDLKELIQADKILVFETLNNRLIRARTTPLSVQAKCTDRGTTLASTNLLIQSVFWREVKESNREEKHFLPFQLDNDSDFADMTRNQINDTFLFQNRVKVKVVGEVSEKWN